MRLLKQKFNLLSLYQLMLIALIPMLFHAWNLQGVDYYFYKAERPWSGGSTYIQECFLQGWLAWMVGAGKSLKSFQGFNLFCAYLWLIFLNFFILQRSAQFSDKRRFFLQIIVPLVMIFHTATISITTTLGFPDPLTALFGLFLIFVNSPILLFFSAMLGMLSHPTQFMFVGLSALVFRLAVHEDIPWNALWKTLLARSIVLGLIIGKISVWSLQKATFSGTSEQRLKWVSDRNFTYWWNLSVKQPNDYWGLHAGFWFLALFLIFVAFKLSKKVGFAYLVSLGLGLLTTFISEDRPRIFISIATPVFIGTLVYVLSHPRSKSFLIPTIILSLVGIAFATSKLF